MRWYIFRCSAFVILAEALAAAKTEEIKAGTKQIETKKEEKVIERNGHLRSGISGWEFSWSWFTTTNFVADIYQCREKVYILVGICALKFLNAIKGSHWPTGEVMPSGLAEQKCPRQWTPVNLLGQCWWGACHQEAGDQRHPGGKSAA